MSELELQAQTRTKTGRAVKTLRRAGVVPAVVYGKKTKSALVQVDYRAFEKLYQKAGESTLITLVLDGQPLRVIIHDVVKDAVSDRFSHVDFHQVDLTEKVEAEIELVFAGEPPAVKELGGVLVKSLDKIKVEALPQNLVPQISVDISGLRTFDDIIHVSDLKLPSTLTVLDKGDEPVALVQAPRSEAELEELNQVAEDKVGEVEKVEKEKGEEEEAVEAAPPEANKKSE